MGPPRLWEMHGKEEAAVGFRRRSLPSGHTSFTTELSTTPTFFAHLLCQALWLDVLIGRPKSASRSLHESTHRGPRNRCNIALRSQKMERPSLHVGQDIRTEGHRASRGSRRKGRLAQDKVELGKEHICSPQTSFVGRLFCFVFIQEGGLWCKQP